MLYAETLVFGRGAEATTTILGVHERGAINVIACSNHHHHRFRCRHHPERGARTYHGRNATHNSYYNTCILSHTHRYIHKLL